MIQNTNPDSKSTILFFWDYDAEWGAERSRGPGGPKPWGHLEFTNTDELLSLHQEYGIPACFAVVGEAARAGKRPYHDPDQIRRIHGAGHEVASHSLRHDWLPGLGWTALLATLKESKDSLEHCIGAPVVTFVPPYNQPFDYLDGCSISLAERKEAKRDRIDLKRLCQGLLETGYQFCRVAYRPLWQRLREFALKTRLDRPQELKRIGGVTCVRLNSPGGFRNPTPELVERCAAEGGIAVVYGHPHSLHAGNSQDAAYLVPLMARIRELKNEGRVRLALPRELLAEG